MGLILSMDDALMMEIVFYFILFANILIFLFVLSSSFKYDIKYLMFGNASILLQHLFVLLSINTPFRFSFLVNVFDILAATFYIIAFMRVYDLKVPLNKIGGMLLIAVIVLFPLSIWNSLHSWMRFATNIFVAVVYLQGVLLLYKKDSKNHLGTYSFLRIILILAVLLKLTVVVVRLYSTTYEVSIESIQSSVVIFTFFNLLLAISMNVALLFSQYDVVYSRLKESSSMDFLTGVYNRRFIYDKITELLSMEKRELVHFAVILLDINGFKSINDQFGHVEGDRILYEFANQLQEQTRDIDYVGRYGGDEFLIVAMIDNEQSFGTLRKRILEFTKTIKTIEDKPISISGGAYLSTSKTPLTSIDEIIHYVDQLLYSVKSEKEHEIKY